MRLLRGLWRWLCPQSDPPCIKERTGECKGYGSQVCTCADIDAWTSH